MGEARHKDGSAGDVDYGEIGRSYGRFRQPEPIIAAQIQEALGDAKTVLNVGAGTGSYEPSNREVTAVEPSASMRAQRPANLGNAVNAVAEDLPFENASFDASMATVTVHQWSDLEKGLAEMRRVTRGPVVLLVGDPALMQDYWLNDYIPEVRAIEANRFPPLHRIATALGQHVEVTPVLHRVRLMLSRQRTQLSNAMRAHMSEFGVVERVGRLGLERLLAVVEDHDDHRIPTDARTCLEMLMAQLVVVKEQILENDRRIRANARETEIGRRLMEIPGVGPLLASAFVASVADPTVFRTGRDLAAWIGLVPKQNSSGGKERLGGISRAGNRYLRQMLVVGAMAVIRHAERHGTRRPWLIQLLARRAKKVAAVALANKTARMVWALMTSGERYREPAAMPA